MAMRMQAIEFKTTRIAEIEALVRARRGRAGATVIHGTVTARRDRPDTYLTIVEIASDLVLGRGAGHPEVRGLLADIAPLCDEPPQLYELAVGSIPEPRAPLDTAGRNAGRAPAWLA
jgi:hypothetical protein